MTSADTTVSNEPTGGPSLPQERRLVTEIPGPRSTELFARRTAACARGLGTTLPVFIEKAGGGVLVDVDGNSLIDLGAGIAVVNVGNSADAVVRNVQAQVAAFTHTCFMVTPYTGYVEVCEALNRLTPGTTRRSPRSSTRAPRLWRTRSRSRGRTPVATRSSSSSTGTTGGRT
jgi:4-aminobutyrate aminotransferase/(S)-3-amino-2-methylpropionate transaminase